MGNDARWFRLNVDWWEREWCLVLSSEARLCWVLLLGRIGSSGQRGSIPKSPIQLLARQWLVGEESIRQMLTAAIGAGELIDKDDSWTVSDPSIFAKDPTAAERKQAQRTREKGEVSQMSRDVTDVTTQNSTEQDSTEPPKSPKGEKKPPVDFEGAACPDCLKEAALTWQSYKRAKGQAWKLPTWERNFAKYADEPFKFALMVDYTIERGYQGLLMPEGKKPGSAAAPSLMERTGGKGV